MSARWSEQDVTDYEARRGGGVRIQIASKPKYGNKKTEVDGIIFDSKKEAARYAELSVLQQGGAIQGLTLQPTYELIVNGELICKYIADFAYIEHQAVVVEDVKSKATRTPVYRLKKKLMKAIYGIVVRET